MSQTEQDLLRAKRLIQAKHYEDAKALLVTIDHPTADKWLQRLQVISTAPTVAPPSKADNQDFTLQLVISIGLLFVLFIPGLIAVAIFKRQAQEYPDAPGAQGILLLSRIIKWIVRIIIVLLVILLIILILSYVALSIR